VPNKLKNNMKNSITFCFRSSLLWEAFTKTVLIFFCKTDAISRFCLRSAEETQKTPMIVPINAMPNPSAIEIYNEALNISTTTIQLGLVTTLEVDNARQRMTAVPLYLR